MPELAGAGGLNPARFLVSKLSVLAARLAFPRRLRHISDPMSGYFLVRRESLDPERLRPRGFKILLEILVRFPHLSASQVPFQFDSRHSGQSKAGLREGLRYLKGLLALRFGGLFQRAARFGLVGASGIVVNLLFAAAFTDVVGLHYLAAAILATQGSTLWNFTFTEAWVFRDRSRNNLPLRLAQFLLVNNATLLLRGPFLVILTSGLGIHYLASTVISLLALSLGRYLLADGWIWPNGAPKPQRGRFWYDIHGIVRVDSEARLPELEYFATSTPADQPDITITTRRSTFPVEQATEATNGNKKHFRYHEGLGPFGFWVDIARGEATDVLVGHLVKLSPHVLYTNVVEPILRWMLVQKGYALVHGACTCLDGQAALVTAKTDTGKTTTILRLLTHHPLAFLSDDMVILRPDGKLLCYPKPLTISRHTLCAVNGATLSLWQRLALQVQSRVHSKSGRRTALTLTRMPLPMASVNAVAQIVVPPPKYFIDQLIPEVTTAREGSLSHLVVIEVGDDLEMSLNFPEAVKILLGNCEDAYGFPPYDTLAPFLYSEDGQDLRIKEREIITQALAGCPATLVRSRTRNWWQRLPGLLEGCLPAKGPVSVPQPAVETYGAPPAPLTATGEMTSATARWEEDDSPEWL